MRILKADLKVMSEVVRAESPDNPGITEIVVDVPYYSGPEFAGLDRQGIIRAEIYRGQLLADMIAYYDTIILRNWEGTDFVPFRTENQYKRDGIIGQVAAGEVAIVVIHESEKVIRISFPLTAEAETPVFAEQPSRARTI